MLENWDIDLAFKLVLSKLRFQHVQDLEWIKTFSEEKWKPENLMRKILWNVSLSF